MINEVYDLHTRLTAQNTKGAVLLLLKLYINLEIYIYIIKYKVFHLKWFTYYGIIMVFWYGDIMEPIVDWSSQSKEEQWEIIKNNPKVF